MIKFIQNRDNLMIYLATDHRGYELKEKIKTWLSEWGYEYKDMGAYEYDPDDDYPDFVHKAAEKVSQDPEDTRAIILGMSGQGEAMVANRYKGVRAAVFYGPSLEKTLGTAWYRLGGLWGWDPFMFKKIYKKTISLFREHNNSNVLSLGVEFLNDKTARAVIKLWLETPFSEEERHIRRIAKIDK